MAPRKKKANTEVVTETVAVEPVIVPKVVTEPVEIDHKTLLANAGFRAGESVDDRKTKAAIKMFQKVNGLPITYELDDVTLKALNNVGI